MATVRFDDLASTNRLAALPISALNEIYASLVQTTVDRNDCSTKTGIGTRGPVTRFHSKVPPPLPVQDYLERLTKFTPFRRDALLLSSVYLNRISHLALVTAYSACGEPFTDDPLPPRDGAPLPQPLVPSYSPARPDPVVVVSPLVLPTSRSNSNGSLPSFSLSASPPLSPPTHPPLSPSTSTSTSSRRRIRPAPLLNQFTLHRLLLSTLLVATKYSVDGTLSQSRAAKVGGVSTTELTRLEAETLRLLGWSLYVTSEELEQVSSVWATLGTELGVVSSLSAVEPVPIVTQSPTRLGEEEPSQPTGTRSRSPLPPSPPLPTVPPASSFSHTQFRPPLPEDRLRLPTLLGQGSSTRPPLASTSPASSVTSSSTSSPSITFSPPLTTTTTNPGGNIIIDRSVGTTTTTITATELTPPSSPGGSTDGKPRPPCNS